MFKKTLTSVVSAAVLAAVPGQFTLTAAAQTMTRGFATGVSVTPPIAPLNNPVYGASSLYVPALTPGAPAAAKSLVPAAAKAVSVTAQGMPLAVIASPDEKAGVVEKAAALEALFENSPVAGRASPEVLVSVKSRASLEKAQAGGSVSEASDELARRKAAIEAARKEKAQAGGSIAARLFNGPAGATPRQMALAAAMLAFGALWGLTLGPQLILGAVALGIGGFLQMAAWGGYEDFRAHARDYQQGRRMSPPDRSRLILPLGMQTSGFIAIGAGIAGVLRGLLGL